VYHPDDYRALNSMADTVSPKNGDNMTTTPAGWYPNQQGQQQWWDGHQWGQIAAPVTIIQAPAMKSEGVSYLLLLLLGTFGAHRFYLRRPGTAILMLLAWWGGWALTFAGVGFILVGAVIVWWIIDLFLIPGMARTTRR
jgi:TM2 domain-containing membrane protein YozV